MAVLNERMGESTAIYTMMDIPVDCPKCENRDLNTIYVKLIRGGKEFHCHQCNERYKRYEGVKP